MTTVADTARELTVRTDDGADLAVTVLAPLEPRDDAGDVLLVHGWAHSRRAWGAVADRLIRRGHRVVVYDQRGHGASTTGRAPVAVERLGADLAAVAERTAAHRPVVVGHSGGGFAALSYAALDPRAAELGGLVLLGAAAHGQDTPDSEVRMMGSALFSRALSLAPLGRRLLASTMSKKPDARVLDVNRQMFAATAPEVRADFFRCTRGWDLRPRLASVTVPAVVLHGDRDTVVDIALARTMAQALPRARFERIEGAGHMLPLEHPHAVVDAVGAVTSLRP